MSIFLVPAMDQSSSWLSGVISSSDLTPTEGETVTLTFEDTSIEGEITSSDLTPTEGETVTLEFVPVANTYQWLDGITGEPIVGATSLTVPWIVLMSNRPHKIRVTNPTTGKSRVFNAPSHTITPAGDALAVSDTTPTEGDMVTFTGLGRLYKDGAWVYEAEELPFSRRVSTLDSGTYTADEGSPVVVTVAESYILSDDFETAVSGDWDVVAGTPDLTGDKFNLDLTALGTGTVSLTKNTITDPNTRFALKIDHSLMSSGTLDILEALDENDDVLIKVQVVFGAPNLIKIIYGAGLEDGGAKNFGYNTGWGFGQWFVTSPVTNVEARCDATGQEYYIFVDDVQVTSIINAVNTILPVTSIRVGKLNADSLGGTVTVDEVRIKQGEHIAAQRIWAYNRVAGIAKIGQSNAVSAGAGYDAVVDYVGKYAWVFGAEGIQNGAIGQVDGFVNIAANHPPSSTSLAFAYVQTLTLPAGYIPGIIAAAQGSVGISDGYWADGGQAKIDAINACEYSAECFEEYMPFGILTQLGETDATAGWSKAQYITGFTDLVDDIRTAMGGTVDSIPVTVGGLSPYYLTDGTAPDADFIRIDEASQDYCDILANNARYVSTLDITVMDGQEIHFDDPGVIDLGYEHGQKHVELRPYAVSNRLGGRLRFAPTILAWGDSGWCSAELVDGQSVRIKVIEPNVGVIYGLDASNVTPKSFADIDCGVQWVSTVSINLYTNGYNGNSPAGDYQPGYEHVFEKSGTSVLLKQDGVTLYTWTSVPANQRIWIISSAPNIRIEIGGIGVVNPTEEDSTLATYRRWIL